jgi:hypothetical protein
MCEPHCGASCSSNRRIANYERGILFKAQQVKPGLDAAEAARLLGLDGSTASVGAYCNGLLQDAGAAMPAADVVVAGCGGSPDVEFVRRLRDVFDNTAPKPSKGRVLSSIRATYAAQGQSIKPVALEALFEACVAYGIVVSELDGVTRVYRLREAPESDGEVEAR